MSANANGAPTTLGIPTLAVTDPVTKDGINEITTSVDSKIATRMFAPAAPADKQVVKWSQSGLAWVAGNVAPSELSQDGASNGNVLVWNNGTGKWVPGNGTPTGTAGQRLVFVGTTLSAVTPGSVSRQVGSLGGTTSTTYVMAGLGATFTPTFSGRLQLAITGWLNVGGGGTESYLKIAYGTGSAPANGAGPSGTVAGLTHQQGAGGDVPTALTAIITGLTVGTAYWIDLQQQISGNPNALTIQGLYAAGTEF